MTDLILKAIITGFILSIMVGPVFFVLLETSIRKGIRAAIAFDIGVFLSDIIYILIAFVFFSEVKHLAEGEGQNLAKILGGALFIAYGVYNFFKKPKSIKVGGDGKPVHDLKDYALLSLKGFLLNFANPMVIFYWFSVLTLSDKGQDIDSSTYTFIVILLGTFFSIDLLKIVGAKQLRPLITGKLLTALNQLIGIVFVVFGLVLIFQSIVANT